MCCAYKMLLIALQKKAQEKKTSELKFVPQLKIHYSYFFQSWKKYSDPCSMNTKYNLSIGTIKNLYILHGNL